MMNLKSTMLELRAVICCAAMFVLCGAAIDAQQDDAALAHARRILAHTPVIDGHNDLPWRIREDSIARGDLSRYDLRTRARGSTDLARLRQGMVGGQFWSVYVPGEYRDSGYARVQLEQIALARRLIARYPDRLQLALTAADIRASLRTGKIASLLGMEGGHAIEESIGALQSYYDLGVRYMTLTHNVTLNWADAALDSSKHGGLTPFGKRVILEMNRLGMLVDLSHVSPATMSDALNAARAPVIFSHSGARALVDSPRNVPDSILVRVRQNGGVVMVPFVPMFVSSQVAKMRNAPKRSGAHSELPVATLADVANQIDHIGRIAGVDHVGLGGDFDGMSDSIRVRGLEDVSKYPNLFAELIRRGWSDDDLGKLASNNILRVLRDAERVARQLQDHSSLQR